MVKRVAVKLNGVCKISGADPLVGRQPIPDQISEESFLAASLGNPDRLSFRERAL